MLRTLHAQPKQQANALSSKVAGVRRVCRAGDDNDSGAGQRYEPNSLPGGEQIVAAPAPARIQTAAEAYGTHTSVEPAVWWGVC